MRVDVTNVDEGGGRLPDCRRGSEALAAVCESVRQAVENAVRAQEAAGFVHPQEDRTALRVEGAEVLRPRAASDIG